jgi:shikimate kinase
MMDAAMMDTAADLKGTSIYLIGMMGSGKTTVGKGLATALGYRYFDTDQLIEGATQQSIAQIFAESGEGIFRELETRTVESLTPMLRCVVATGGGIVLKPENWGHLRNGVIVWLDVPLDLLHNRLAADSTRPLLQGEDLQERLRALDAERRSLYAQADIAIVVGGRDSPTIIVNRILAAVSAACQSKAVRDQEILAQNREQPFELN